MDDLIIQYYDEVNRNRIYFLREDLLPLACGGNKVRIGLELISDAKRKGATCIVAYGNSRSNLCRALVMLSARQGLDCVIVSPNDDDGTRVRTINSRIIERYGTRVITCEKGADVSFTIQTVLDQIQSEGGIPYYIFGNRFGNGNERVLMSAYLKVAEEIHRYEDNTGLIFDRIALPFGTGATYAGLWMGNVSARRAVKITGFTIARPLDRCRKALSLFVEDYRQRHPDFIESEPDISDIALSGGYAKTTGELLEFLGDVLKKNAVLLDATYVGKAYWGLVRTLVERDIRNETILFVYTGSLPLAFDTLLKE